MKHKTVAFVGGVVFVIALALPFSILAQTAQRRDGRLSLGADVGVHLSTPDSTAFALALNGDYFLTDNLSLGPLVQVGLTDDLFLFGPSVQLKYTHDLNQRLSANLQGGIGFIYAELDRSGPDRDDATFLIPVGPGVKYKLTDDLSLGSTLLFNFTNLNGVRNERIFVSLLGGLKFRF
jgi:Outer membrane protein beta-barrel domain